MMEKFGNIVLKLDSFSQSAFEENVINGEPHDERLLGFFLVIG